MRSEKVFISKPRAMKMDLIRRGYRLPGQEVCPESLSSTLSSVNLRLT
jgi:hypothetical protein